MARKPKPSGRPLSRKRTRGRRPLRKRVLIVCEGERTEMIYFEHFHTNAITLDVRGIGKSPQHVLRRAHQIQQDEDFDEVWIVFDKDHFGDGEFNQTIRHASKMKIRVAYSNPCFELWFLLHFVYQETPLTCQDCRERLSQFLGRRYEKNALDLYNLLVEHQEDALRHAERLERYHYEAARASSSTRNYALENPSTTVHHLVKRLRAAQQAMNKP